jgi:protein phosphatase
MDARSLGIEVSAATAPGRRKINADAFVIDEAAGLLAVADGMGDEERSVRVARMALDAVRERFGPPWSWLPPEDRTMSDAIERFLRGVGLANRRIHEAQAAEPSRIGTTFAGVAVCGPFLTIAHVGDSRAYLLRGATGELGALTQDHTVLGDALWRGVPYETAAGLHKAHALTRTVGRKPAVETRTSIAAWAPGDVAVLCTDGVSDWVHLEAMTRALAGTNDVAEAARALVDAAGDLGGWDDATAVVLRHVECTRQQGSPEPVRGTLGEVRR